MYIYIYIYINQYRPRTPCLGYDMGPWAHVGPWAQAPCPGARPPGPGPWAQVGPGAHIISQARCPGPILIQIGPILIS